MPSSIDPRVFITVPAPRHPDGEVRMYEGYSQTPDRLSPRVVFVDAEKFMRFWEAQERQHYSGLNKVSAIFSGTWESIKHDLELFNSSVETSRHYMDGYGDILTIDMPRINFVSTRECPLSFNNGRHRTINLSKLGAAFIPMELSEGSDREKFIELFGWKGNVHKFRLQLDL